MTTPLTSNCRHLQTPSRGRRSRYALSTGLAGPLRSYGRLEEENNLSLLPRIDPRLLRDTARNLLTVPTELAGPLRSYGRSGEENNLSLLPRIDPRLLRDPARNLLTVPTELPRCPTHRYIRFPFL